MCVVLTEQPRWVPDWIWVEYLSGMKGDYPPPSYSHQKDTCELLSHLLSSPQCGTLWPTLERHSLKRTHADHFGFRMNHLLELTDEVQRALYGLAGYNRMTKSERTKVSANIVKRVSQLRALLMQLSGINDVSGHSSGILPLAVLLPPEFPLAASQLSDERFEENRAHIPPEFQDVAKGVMMGCYVDPLEALKAIERGAEEFGKSRPVVPRPNLDSANRTYFIRTISNYFFAAYGTPLRAATLAVTSVFFDCGDLDESAVAQLAPCD